MRWLHFILFYLIIFRAGVTQPLDIRRFPNEAAYPFLLYKPVDTTDRPLPLILFLHGRSLSGRNLELVRRYGVIDALERGMDIPAMVVAPQVSVGEFWKPEKVLTVLDYVQRNHKIDSTRIYVVGMSLGGFGTLSFVGKYPDRIAAAVALCGGGNVKDACNLAKVNLWIKHGSLDKAVPVSESIKIHKAIKECSPEAECQLTIYPNAGHSALAREFYKPELYEWLFRHVRTALTPATSLEK